MNIVFFCGYSPVIINEFLVIYCKITITNKVVKYEHNKKYIQRFYNGNGPDGLAA